MARYRVIIINLALIIVGAVILEAIFGTWRTDAHVLYRFTMPRNVVWHFANELPGQPDVSTYTTDRFGLRGLDSSPRDIFILTVGGSTTDQRRIDDRLTYEEALQAKFKAEGRMVDIVSAGIDGQSTYGHIVNFRGWFPSIPDLRPKYILFYIGINDFFDLSKRDSYDRATQEKRRSFSRWFFGYIKENSALYNLWKVLWSLISPPPQAHYKTGRMPDWSSVPMTRESYVESYATPDVAKSLDQLSQRVAVLAKETRQLGATPIFVTQRSAYWTRKEGQVLGVTSFKPGPYNKALHSWTKLSGIDIYNLERLQAGAIMTACRSAGAICIDLAEDIPFDRSQHFYDPYHTTPAGSTLIAERLFGELKDIR